MAVIMAACVKPMYKAEVAKPKPTVLKTKTRRPRPRLIRGTVHELFFRLGFGVRPYIKPISDQSD